MISPVLSVEFMVNVDHLDDIAPSVRWDKRP